MKNSLSAPPDYRALEALLPKVGAAPNPARVRDILAKARTLSGLSNPEAAELMTLTGPDALLPLFNTARDIKERIYGRRLVLFAPLYISNLCANECLYCAFRSKNRDIVRRALTQDEIATETAELLRQGHKRILLVAGESYPREGFAYVLRSIETIYRQRLGRAAIRRINANVAPLSLEQFRDLKGSGIGTYQLFQETYHPDTYRKVHCSGPKADYVWRVNAFDRAMEAGIDDVGTGVLFGLHDWRFEILALLTHARRLEERFGAGPHTVSVPRLEPAEGSSLSEHSPCRVSDEDFLKLVAILRCAVPYTGIIMSTRETPDIRRQTFALGVSQISAGSRTDPGGYAGAAAGPSTGQFSLGDHRPLDEVISDIAGLGYIPSFCTACYRRGRTGADFMDLARPGDIKTYCDPNACSTFTEYLEDYATPVTRETGEQLIGRVLDGMEPGQRDITRKLVAEVKRGGRDCCR